MGLSMGGTLALRLAEQRGDDVAGLVLVNPSLATERKDATLLPCCTGVVPSVPGIGNDIKKPGVTELAYDRLPLQGRLPRSSQLWTLARADLGRVTQPVLLYRSRDRPRRRAGQRAGCCCDGVRTPRRHRAACSRTATTSPRSTTTPRDLRRQPRRSIRTARRPLAAAR